MKGQRVNISWMHLITYCENRDKKTYIGNGLRPISATGTWPGTNRTASFWLCKVSFCPEWKHCLWEETEVLLREITIHPGRKSREGGQSGAGQAWGAVVGVQMAKGPERLAPRALNGSCDRKQKTDDEEDEWMGGWKDGWTERPTHRQTD